MADSSTTSGPILDPIAGGCWARRRLRSGIKDVSVASKLRKSLTLVRVVFIDTLAIPDLDGRFLHNHSSDPGSDCGGLLGSTPASSGIKDVSVASKLRKSLTLVRVIFIGTLAIPELDG